MNRINQHISIIASDRVSVAGKFFLNMESVNNIKKAVVIITNKGNSFFIVLSFTLIGLMVAATPTIKRMFTMHEPITLAKVMSGLDVLIELNDMASSGAQVPKAATVSAISILGTFK